MHNKVMGRTRTGSTEVYAQSLGADFDLATWFFFPTHCLVMMILCAKLFLNPTMQKKLWFGHEQVPLKSMHKV